MTLILSRTYLNLVQWMIKWWLNMRCDIRQNSFIELCYSELHLFHLVVQLCNAYWQLGRLLFGKKFHSVRNFIRQQISFGTKFHSARIFIRHEISFGKNFHSARNFIPQEISFGTKFHSAGHSETKIWQPEESVIYGHFHYSKNARKC